MVDTHLLLCFVLDPSRLAQRAARLRADQAVLALYSLASIRELAIQTSLRKPGVDVDPKVLRQLLTEEDSTRRAGGQDAGAHGGSGAFQHGDRAVRQGQRGGQFGLTFRTSCEANGTNFRVESALGQGLLRGAWASMSLSVSSSQACMSFFALRWLAIACSSRTACSAVRVRCTSLPPRMCPHS